MTARRHVYLCPLRWADMDSFGHVNNVVYLRYLEQARVDWMFETAREAGVEKFSLGTVVARHEIDYKRPLVYRAATGTRGDLGDEDRRRVVHLRLRGEGHR